MNDFYWSSTNVMQFIIISNNGGGGENSRTWDFLHTRAKKLNRSGKVTVQTNEINTVPFNLNSRFAFLWFNMLYVLGTH